MRELKFRAWYDNGTTKEMMFVGDSYGTKHNLDCCKYLLEGQPVKLMQFTGLRDKNGVEVYEGDFIRIGSNEVWLVNYHPEQNPNQAMQELQTGVVEYVGASFVFRMMPCADGYPLSTLLLHENRGGLLVIGNIHQSPELLK